MTEEKTLDELTQEIIDAFMAPTDGVTKKRAKPSIEGALVFIATKPKVYKLTMKIKDTTIAYNPTVEGKSVHLNLQVRTPKGGYKRENTIDDHTTTTKLDGVYYICTQDIKPYHLRGAIIVPDKISDTFDKLSCLKEIDKKEIESLRNKAKEKKLDKMCLIQNIIANEFKEAGWSVNKYAKNDTPNIYRHHLAQLTKNGGTIDIAPNCLSYSYKCAMIDEEL